MASDTLENFASFSTCSGPKKFEVSSKTPAVGRELNQYPFTCTPLSAARVINIVRMSIPDSHTQNGEDARNRGARVCKQQILAKIIGYPIDWTPNEGRRLAQSKRTVAFGPLETSQTKLQSLKSHSYLKIISFGNDSRGVLKKVYGQFKASQLCWNTGPHQSLNYDLTPVEKNPP